MGNTTRQTATFILSSTSRCFRLKTARPRLLVPTQRRCLHQEQEQQASPRAATARSYRPVRTTAPFPMKEQKPFTVNEDPERLDAMYRRLLGGDLGLSDEVKWQAITHKSFDHGWQPFNEKLVIFGKKVVLLQTSLHLLNTRPKSLEPPRTDLPRIDPPSTPPAEESNVLKRFFHPDYKYLTYIHRFGVNEIMNSRNLSELAKMAGVQQVMRWKPADNNDMVRSAQSNIASECIYAIVGAVALQKGGNLAARVVRERILEVILGGA